MREKEYFIEQLSMLLGAGMPVSTALSSKEREFRSKINSAMMYPAFVSLRQWLDGPEKVFGLTS